VRRRTSAAASSEFWVPDMQPSDSLERRPEGRT
jgi:hypothetical protein